MHTHAQAHSFPSLFLVLRNSHFILNRVGRILLLLALLVWTTDVQILHVSGQHLRDSDARKNAHHGCQHQHQTHLKDIAV